MSSSTPDYGALQVELRPSEQRAVEEWCALRDVPVEDWPMQSRLGCFLDLALDRYMGRLPVAWSGRRKLSKAAGRFNLSLPALRKRYQRDGLRPGRRRYCAAAVVDLEAERAASRERKRAG